MAFRVCYEEKSLITQSETGGLFYWAVIEPMTAQCREIQQWNTRGCGAEQRLLGVRLEMCVCTWEHLRICPDPSYRVCVCMCAWDVCVCVCVCFQQNQKRISLKSWLLSLLFFSKLSKCPARSAKFLSSSPLCITTLLLVQWGHTRYRGKYSILLLS